MADTLYFTGQINDSLSFTGDGTADQIIATGQVAAAGPQGGQGIQGVQGNPGLTVSVNSVTQVAGNISIDTDDIPEGTNKYVSASQLSDISSNTSARHSHANKALLDTYTQTESDLADAVAKKHTPVDISGKQDTLVSGTNIKTINGSSVLGSGNMVISGGGGGGGTWGSITGTLSDQTDLNSALTGKEDVANKSTTTTLGTSDTLYPSQKAVKTYVDDAVTVTEMPGAAPYRSKYLDQWFDKLKDSNTAGPLDIVVVGDSIASGESVSSPTARPWPWVMSDILARKDYRARLSPSPAVAQIAPDGYAPALSPWGKTMTTCEGTPANTGVGRYSSTMTNGQVATQVVAMDAVSVLYNTHADGGLIEVRDGGAGGTLLTTIDTAGTTKGGQMWTSSALTYGTHTIHLKAVCTGGQTVVLNGVYSYSGNLTKGIRVWPSARSGITTATATSDQTFFLDFIDTIDPDLVILATGANDTEATYTTRMQDMIDATRAKTSADIALWGCYAIAGLDKYKDEQAVLARQMALDNNLQIIDAFLILPDIRAIGLLTDGIHPTAAGVKIIAWQAYSIVSGDPFGFIMRELPNKVEQSELTTTQSTLQTAINLKANTANPTFTGTVTAPTLSSTTITASGDVNNVGGRFIYSQFFGSPFHYMKGASADTQPIMSMAGAGFNNFAYSVNAVGIFMGAGGATAPDTNLYRSAADTLKTDDTLIVGTAGTSAGSAVTIDGTQTLTNKTHTSPVINTGVSGTAIDTDATLAANSDTKIASQKAVKTYADTKQATLVSGTNIKTINSTSILGSGDIAVSGLWTAITGGINYSGGSVGIGTTTLTQKLNVNGSIQAAGLFCSDGNGSKKIVTNGNDFVYSTFASHGFNLFDGSAYNPIMTLKAEGLGIGTTSPTKQLDISGDTFRVRTAKTPASASATGAVGEICWDSSYIYICVATNTWKRTAIATW